MRRPLRPASGTTLMPAFIALTAACNRNSRPTELPSNPPSHNPPEQVVADAGRPVEPVVRVDPNHVDIPMAGVPMIVSPHPPTPPAPTPAPAPSAPAPAPTARRPSA
ncbi:MAG: hypothetical protein HY909_25100, partial [Deltaproteobacteria bacterium]|nr:hypothetical protein [Deltaproteobacteria bacterium]